MGMKVCMMALVLSLPGYGAGTSLSEKLGTCKLGKV